MPHKDPPPATDAELCNAAQKAAAARAKKYATTPRGKAEARVQEIARQRGGELVGQYEGYNAPSLFRCAQGHEFRRNVTQLKGFWCPRCASEDVAENFRQHVQAQGGVMLGEYLHSQTPVEIECAHGHRWEPRPAEVNRGRWCPECNSRSAAAEARLAAIAEERGVKLVSYRTAQFPITYECVEGTFTRRRSEIGNGLTWCRGCTCRGKDYTVRCVTDDDGYTFLYLGKPPAPLPIHLGPLFATGIVEDYYEGREPPTKLREAVQLLKEAIRESAAENWKVVNVWANPQWVGPGQYTWDTIPEAGN